MACARAAGVDRMKHILVTGANGFVGQALTRRLLADGACERLTLVDLTLDDAPDDPRVRRVAGSIAEDGVLATALEPDCDGVFHLASLPGGAAERQPALGLDVNLRATLTLLELLRQRAVENPGQAPTRLVFTSTIAVYGSPLPDRVDDATPTRPTLSYGAQKLAAEILLSDYGRRGWVDGCALRLPGIVARPLAPNGLLSAFMSEIFWALAAGRPFVCPVSAQAVAWWMSVGTCVDNLLHAAALPPSTLTERRVFTLPVLRLTIADLVDGLAAQFGEDRRRLVTHAPDPALEAGFGAFPPLDATAAAAVGFRHDGDVGALIRRALAA